MAEAEVGVGARASKALNSLSLQNTIVPPTPTSLKFQISIYACLSFTIDGHWSLLVLMLRPLKTMTDHRVKGATDG